MAMLADYTANLVYIRDMYTILHADLAARKSNLPSSYTPTELATAMDGVVLASQRLKSMFENEAGEKKLTAVEQCVYAILSNKEWYSYSTTATMKLCNIKSHEDLRSICKTLATKLKDPINFFKYNEIEYVGLETRRVDYERDKAAGVNPIEKLIELGVYGKHTR